MLSWGAAINQLFDRCIQHLSCSSHICGHADFLVGRRTQHGRFSIVNKAPLANVVRKFEDVDGVPAPANLTAVPGARHGTSSGPTKLGGIVRGSSTEALRVTQIPTR